MDAVSLKNGLGLANARDRAQRPLTGTASPSTDEGDEKKRANDPRQRRRFAEEMGASSRMVDHADSQWEIGNINGSAAPPSASSRTPFPLFPSGTSSVTACWSRNCRARNDGPNYQKKLVARLFPSRIFWSLPHLFRSLSAHTI